MFLGTFGAHLFYLGEKRKARLRLIFFWTCIPTILGIIDAFKMPQRVVVYNTALAHDLYDKVKAVPQEAKEAAVKEATKYQDMKEKEVKESVQAPPLTSQAASLEESRDAKRGEMLDLALDTADAMDALSVLQEAAQGTSVEAVEEAADEDGEDESEENEETSLLSDLLGSSDDDD